MGGIVNPKQTYTYQQMIQDIRKLEQTYSDILTTDIIGKSVDERNIYSVKLGTGKVEIFINGAHHAREWLTTSLIMHMIDAYSQAYVNHGYIGPYDAFSILSKTSIWFIPMVNPDGVTLVQRGHHSANNPESVLAINKGNQDFSAWKANIRGVDLNRQYPAGWDAIESDPGKPSAAMYKGPHPLSEPETKSVYKFTLAHDFQIAVSYHSSGEELFWQYNSTGELYRRTRKLADMISKKTGYQLVFPGPNPSGGGYTDWFLDTIKRPGFTPEISPLVGPRPVPVENYDKIWQQNKEVGLMLAQQAFDQQEK